MQSRNKELQNLFNLPYIINCAEETPVVAGHQGFSIWVSCPITVLQTCIHTESSVLSYFTPLDKIILAPLSISVL
jgi:hypothetical protein